jgi:putative ABC transport system substrate-binding protein
MGMRRREFITLIGGAAVTWPLAARAQQPSRIRRVGVLIPYAESDAEAQTQVTAFREALDQFGWHGNNLRVDYRWTGGDVGRIRTFAKELIALQPDVILGRSTAVTRVLLQETRTIPYSWWSPIQLAMALSIAWHDRAGTLQDSLMSRRHWVASGWNC